MAIIYRQGGNDDFPLPGKNLAIDDDSATSWWGGVQKCAAGIALATCLAATTLSSAIAWDVAEQHQDEVSVRLVDEDYWQNWVAPVQAGLYRALPYSFDEAVWVAPPATFQPDEDFWANPTAPVPASFYQKLPLGDAEEIPAGSLYGQADEDFWQNPVRPVPLSFYQALPYWFDAAEPAGLVRFSTPDEDYWQNFVAPVQTSYWQLASLWMWQEDSNLAVQQPISAPALGRSTRLGIGFSAFR